MKIWGGYSQTSLVMPKWLTVSRTQKARLDSTPPPPHSVAVNNQVVWTLPCHSYLLIHSCFCWYFFPLHSWYYWNVRRIWECEDKMFSLLPLTVIINWGYPVSPSVIINYVITYLITSYFAINIWPLISEPSHVVFEFFSHREYLDSTSFAWNSMY